MRTIILSLLLVLLVGCDDQPKINMTFHNLPLNHLEQIKFFTQKAKEGDPEAMYELGILYDQNQSRLKSKSAIFDLLKRSAAKEFWKASIALSRVYKRGMESYGIPIVEKNTELSKKYTDLATKQLQTAVEQGIPSALVELGELYENGRMGFEEDAIKAGKLYKKGLDIFNKQADAGDAHALLILGYMHKNGRAFLMEDEDKARNYFKRAYTLKYPGSFRSYTYLLDYDTQRQLIEDILKEGAELGDYEAQTGMAQMLVPLSKYSDATEAKLKKALYWRVQAYKQQKMDFNRMTELAENYAALKDYDNAIEIFSKKADSDTNEFRQDQAYFGWNQSLYNKYDITAEILLGVEVSQEIARERIENLIQSDEYKKFMDSLTYFVSNCENPGEGYCKSAKLTEFKSQLFSIKYGLD